MTDGNPNPADIPLSGRTTALESAGSSAAWAIADEAIRRQRAGEPLLMLTLGDPQCPPHPEIVRATVDSLHAGRTHYSPLLGEPALREEIARYTGARAEDVVVVHGAQHAAFALAATLAGPGDEILLSDPYYPTYPPVVAASGATAVPVPAAADFSLDVAALEAAITPKTRVLFLNSPCNPTGAALSKADYAALSRVVRRHGLWLVVDEVYADFRFDGAHVSALDHGPKELTIVINSFSKAFAMTGFRIGWIVGPPRIVDALREWTAASLFGVSQFMQDGATAALRLPRSEFADYRGGFRERAALVLDHVAKIDGLRAEAPKGGMFVMLNHQAIEPDDQRFARTLLDRTGVAVVPGSGFGERGRGHVRISLAPDAAALDDAFSRIAKLVAGY